MIFVWEQTCLTKIYESPQLYVCTVVSFSARTPEDEMPGRGDHFPLDANAWCEPLRWDNIRVVFSPGHPCLDAETRWCSIPRPKRPLSGLCELLHSWL